MCVCGCVGVCVCVCLDVYIKIKKLFQNEQRSRDAAAKKELTQVE